MSLRLFVQSLPADLKLAPIEKKGVNDSTGKKPVNRYRNQDLDGHQVADLMESDPTISAVGLWCGAKNDGVVILDVDHKLFMLERDKSKPLGNPPVIRSTRNDAESLGRPLGRSLDSRWIQGTTGGVVMLFGSIKG